MLKEVDVTILIIISLLKFSRHLEMHLGALSTHTQAATAIPTSSSYKTRILMGKGQIFRKN